MYKTLEDEYGIILTCPELSYFILKKALDL